MIPHGSAGSGIYSSYTLFGFKSYQGPSSGFTIKTATANISVKQVFVGFNKQPPILMFLGDVFIYPAKFNSVEIYNYNPSRPMTVQAFTFDGDLIP